MKIKLEIEGMTCGGCERSVARALTQSPDVEAVTVDRATGSATVDVRDGANLAALVEIVNDAGYDARLAG